MVNKERANARFDNRLDAAQFAAESMVNKERADTRLTCAVHSIDLSPLDGEQRASRCAFDRAVFFKTRR
jgi:hypothetical protein